MPKDTAMTVSIYGKDKRQGYAKEYLMKAGAAVGGHVVLLPVPSSKDGIHITGTDETLDDVIANTRGGDILVGYGIDRARREAIAAMGVTLVDLSRDEKYLADNAELTAVGTLGRILAEERRVPADLSIGIIGCGRIGQRLLHLFCMLGARVRAFTSKRELARDLCMLGISGIDSLTLESRTSADSFLGLDILINTAPARLIPREAASVLSDTRVIELAGGDNIPTAIPYERFASVPAEMYPESAGRVLGSAVLRILG